MTPRFDWTPASEPPSDDRTVLAWMKRGYYLPAHYLDGKWFIDYDGRHTFAVTHWRDIDPPEEA